jgi:hypothetical protein
MSIDGGINPLTGRREITKDYNTIFFHEDDDARTEKIEMWIAKQLGTALVKAYPGYEWSVHVDAIGGVICVVNPSVSTLKGYHLHMKGDTVQDLQIRAVEAGGEILERYGLRRGKVDVAAIENLDRIGPHEEAITADSDGENPIISRHN